MRGGCGGEQSGLCNIQTWNYPLATPHASRKHFTRFYSILGRSPFPSVKPLLHAVLGRERGRLAYMKWNMTLVKYPP